MSYRNSYADGVPLYLNKKYYPVPKPKYKEIDCHIPLDALQEGYDFTLERQAISEFEQHEKAKEERKKYEEELKIRREKRRKEAEEAVAAKAEAAAAKAAALVREYEEEIAKQTKGGRDFTGTTTTTIPVVPRAVGQSVIGNNEVLESPESDSSVRAGSSGYPESNGSVITAAQVDPSEPVVIPSEGSTPSESVTYVPPGAENVSSQEIQPETTRGPPYPVESVTYPVVHHGGEARLNNYYPQNAIPPPAPAAPTPPPPSVPTCTSYQEPLRPYGPTKYVPQPRIPMTAINLSDFESDSADPFDNVELKSINDMAVLATVLQNNVTVPSVLNNLNSDHHHHQHHRGPSNINLNGMVQQQQQPQHQQQPPPGVTYYPYLSHNSNNPHPYLSSWTPTSQNPFYSHFTSTMVTAPITAPPTTSVIGTSASSDSLPLQQQQSAPISTHVPLHRPSPQLEATSSAPQQAVGGTGIPQNNQQQPPLQTVGHPTPENFANFYFPFTSSQAQSRLNNPTDREFS